MGTRATARIVIRHSGGGINPPESMMTPPRERELLRSISLPRGISTLAQEYRGRKGSLDSAWDDNQPLTRELREVFSWTQGPRRTSLNFKVSSPKRMYDALVTEKVNGADIRTSDDGIYFSASIEDYGIEGQVSADGSSKMRIHETRGNGALDFLLSDTGDVSLKFTQSFWGKKELRDLGELVVGTFVGEQDNFIRILDLKGEDHGN